MKKKRTALIFCAFTGFQLYTSMYYSFKMRTEDCCRVLIWNDALEGKADQILSNYFDEVLILKPKKHENRFLLAVDGLIHYGRLFKFSKIGRMLNVWDRIVLIAYSDQQSLSYHVIKEVKKRNYNKVFFIEEGIGTYGAEENRSFKLSIFAKLIGIESVPYIGASNLVDGFIIKRPFDFPSIKLNRAELIKQNNIFLDYEWINSFNALDEVFKQIQHYSNKYIMWLSSPIESAYKLGNNNDVSLLIQLARKMPEKQFLVRLHPSELIEKYSETFLINNITILDLGKYNWIPIEAICGRINPDVLITVISSSAANLHEIGIGKKIIYCYKLFHKIKFDTRIFDPLTNNDAFIFPDSFEELMNAVDEESNCLEMKRNCQGNTNDDIEFLKSAVHN